MNDSGSRSTVGTKKKHHANLSKQQTKLRKVCWSKKEKKKCWKRIYRQQQSRVDEEQRKSRVLDDQPLQLSYLTSYRLSKSESREPDRLFITVKRSPQAKQICISHMEESTATANQKNIWQIWHDVFIAFYSKVHLNDLLMIYGLWDFSRVCLLISKKSNN